jgi:hypothetical protein
MRTRKPRHPLYMYPARSAALLAVRETPRNADANNYCVPLEQYTLRGLYAPRIVLAELCRTIYNVPY